MNRDHSDSSIDAFGYRVRQVLNSATDDISERALQRLSAARSLALTHHHACDPLLALVPTSGDRKGFSHHSAWRTPVAIALSVLVAAAGVFMVKEWNYARSIAEIAEIDTMILSDDLPIDANTDPGFLNFLNSANE